MPDIHNIWFIYSSIEKVVGSNERVNSKNVQWKIWKMPYNFPAG